MKEKGGYPFGGDCFLSGAENYPLCKAMVDHDQQRIKARGSREVGDQVTRDLLEGTRGMRLDWGEWGDSGVCVQLVLLASGTAINVLAHELCETQPLEFRSDELASLEVSRVTSGLVVVAAGKDGPAEGVLRGDIDATLVGQDMVVELPVREARSECSGDVLQGHLQVLEDERVRFG